MALQEKLESVKQRVLEKAGSTDIGQKLDKINTTTTFFQKTLVDVVKGIRSHKKNDKEYIQKCIAEIKEELKSTDTKIKAVAVQKCTYLSMLGYDMEWACFHIVEVMADSNFQHKRIGYLAAAQCFTPDTDVVALTTNLFKKDMQSANQYEAGLALSCVANICTPDLARDLVSDVVALMSSQRSYIRKKVMLVMFKIFLQFPDALRPSFPRLKEKLDDPDPSVVASAVNTICELARKNPANYLGMAPVFFKLLTTIQNNWTLIKIVKLFGALTPLEPRLAKKLVEPLITIINTTPAKSLLYECLNTVSIGMVKQAGILKLALDKLKVFVEDRDQNLKYLGLLGLRNIMNHNPKLVTDMRDTVMECLGDEDVTIRYRALELVVGMVNKKNIIAIVGRLCEQVTKHDGEYKNDLITKIIETCGQNNYEYISNFEWYLRVLMDLVQCELKNVKHGKLLADQFMDVIIRVKGVRDFGILCMFTCLASTNILLESLDTERSNMYEVLHVAAWLCGEYVDKVKDHRLLLENLMQPNVKSLPVRTQSVFVQSILKVFAYIASNNDLHISGEPLPREQQLEDLQKAVTEGIAPYLISSDVEVQERATQLSVFLKLRSELKGEVDIAPAMAQLFEEELLPVGPTTQKKVPVPEGLDLDEQIIEDESSESESEEEEEDYTKYLPKGRAEDGDALDPRAEPGSRSYQGSGTGHNDWRNRDANYLPNIDVAAKRPENDLPPVQAAPIKKDAGGWDLGTKNWRDKGDRKKEHRKKGRRHDSDDSDDEPAKVEIAGIVDLPEGVKPDDDKKDKKKKKPQDMDPNSLEARLNVDLNTPLRDNEVLPVVESYKRPEVSYSKSEDKDKEKDKDRKRDKDRDRDRDRDGKKRHKDSKDKDRDKDRDRDRDHRHKDDKDSRSRDKDRDRDRKEDKDRDRSRDHKDHKDRHGEKEKDRDRDRDREKSSKDDRREKDKDKDKDRSRSDRDRDRDRDRKEESSKHRSSPDDKHASKDRDRLDKDRDRPKKDRDDKPSSKDHKTRSDDRRDEASSRSKRDDRDHADSSSRSKKDDRERERSGKDDRRVEKDRDRDRDHDKDNKKDRDHKSEKKEKTPKEERKEEKPKASVPAPSPAPSTAPVEPAPESPKAAPAAPAPEEDAEVAAIGAAATEETKAPAEPLVASTSPAPAPAPPTTACGENGDISAWYDPDEVTVENGRIVLHLNIETTGTMQRIGLEVVAGDGFIVATDTSNLTPDNGGIVELSVSSANIAAVPPIAGTVKYVVEDEEEEKYLEIVVPMTCSLFVSPEKITPEDFEAVLQTDGLETVASSLDLQKSAMDVRSALASISSMLHVKLVEIKDSVASLYGKTSHGLHVAVIAQAVSESEVAIQVKCTDKAVAAALLEEVV